MKTLRNINSKVAGATEKEVGENKRRMLYKQVRGELEREKKMSKRCGGTTKKVIWGTLALLGMAGMSLPVSASAPTRNEAPYLDNVVTELIVTEIDETNNTFSVMIEENGKTAPFANWDYKWLYVNDGAGTSDDLLSGMTNRRGDWTTLYSRSSQTEPLEKGVEVKLEAIVEQDEGEEVGRPTLPMLATQEISYVMRITQTLEDGTSTGWYTVGRYNYSGCYEGLTDTTGVVCRAERYMDENGVEKVRYNPIMPEGNDSEGGDSGSEGSESGDSGSEGAGNGDSGDSEGSGSSEGNGEGNDGSSEETTAVTQVVEKVVEKTYEIVRAVTNEVPGATRVRYVYSTATNGVSGASGVGASADAENDDTKSDNEAGATSDWGSEGVVKNTETEVDVPALGGKKENEKEWIMPTIIGVIIGAGVMGITWWLFGTKRREEEEDER